MVGGFCFVPAFFRLPVSRAPNPTLSFFFSPVKNGESDAIFTSRDSNLSAAEGTLLHFLLDGPSYFAATKLHEPCVFFSGLRKTPRQDVYFPQRVALL